VVVCGPVQTASSGMAESSAPLSSHATNECVMRRVGYSQLDISNDPFRLLLKWVITCCDLSDGLSAQADRLNDCYSTSRKTKIGGIPRFLLKG